MDFFREQELARRNSRLLTALFLLAVLMLLILTNAFLALVFGAADAFEDSNGLATVTGLFDARVFGGFSLVILVTIAAVVLYNWMRFSQGGRVVAEALGGRPALPSTEDPLESRAQNIVQEIALAANMPVPPLFILDEERGINAFAAGVSPGDAVIAITRGAMVQLTRDELQGVIGHEFSHILNGDMRLSIRLAAMLRGITFIGDIGTGLLRSMRRPRYRTSSKRNDAQALVLTAGLGLYGIGLLGGLMAGLIKSAISKQKEYLADAASVQFTRNPDGIGDALKVIGGHTPGTLIHTARAEEMSHLFFAQVKHRLWTLFATHPTLAQRIERLDPDWDGRFIERKLDHQGLDHLAGERGIDQARRALMAAAPAALAIDLDTPPIAEVPASTDDRVPDLAAVAIEDAREPLGAMSLILALLWHGDAPEKQLAALQSAKIMGLESMVARRGAELYDLSPELRLPLIELCLPALKMLSEPQYRAFKTLLLNFIRADGRIELEEWCLYQLVRHYLDPQFTRPNPRTVYRRLREVSDALAVALGTLALLGQDDTQAAFERGAEALELDLDLPDTDQLGVREFGRAIDKLAACFPLLKVNILKSLVKVAEYDGHITSRELTLIKAIAAVIDCPIPSRAQAHGD